jgi:hypothetical protein
LVARLLGIALVLAPAVAQARSWQIQREVDERGAIFESAETLGSSGATLAIHCNRKPWNRFGTLTLVVTFRDRFAKERLSSVLARLEGSDAVALHGLEYGRTLFLSEQDETVPLAFGMITGSRWSMHATDRSATFDLPDEASQRDRLRTMLDKCRKGADQD